METDKAVAPDPLTAAIGDWGPWQRRQVLLASVFLVPTVGHILIMSFMNAPVEFQCDVDVDGRNRSGWGQCSNCSSWQYDTLQFSNTITQEWDLVCDRYSLLKEIEFFL